MAKARAPRRTLDSYTIKGTNKIVKVGDCVLMRPVDPLKPSYVAKVEKIEADGRGHVKVQVRWYYRPEESLGGRRQFHGVKEVFLSDHFDVQSADTIEGKCTVHSFKSYTKLDAVGNDDFFCRFEYNSTTGAFNPDRVAVYCKCEMPYNPDDLMVQCEGCDDCHDNLIEHNHSNKEYLLKIGFLQIDLAKMEGDGLPCRAKELKYNLAIPPKEGSGCCKLASVKLFRKVQRCCEKILKREYQPDQEVALNKV
ncbi:Bromo adjacent homology (BAH) domain [Macleaya cordata]|uniref:Bromo adjacent homology (BAH) domain n=1 Tax=Macleaya cordata TaxID=56857 RepID=A0A200QE02_MACCD|nr:Bromo adjacent homology (BAH) domain [Macleaya cordata]